MARMRQYGAVDRRPSGRWRARYRRDGATYCRTFATKSDAAAWLAAQQTDQARGAWVDPDAGAVTVAVLAGNWLASNPAKRAGSLARDETIIRCHLVPALGSRRIASVSPDDVQRVVNGWAEARAPRTVRRQYDVVRAVFAFAVARDMLVRSPCHGIKLPKAPAARRRALSPDEVAALAETIGPEHAPIIYTAALLGLRWGEVAGLRVGSLDLLGRTVRIDHQVTRGEHGRPVAGPPKSETGVRTFAVPTALAEILAEHLARNGLGIADADAYVFSTGSGLPLDYTNWRRRVWLPAVARAGLDGIGFHDLRRTNATALVLEGVDLKTAGTRLGHSDPRLTLALYAQATTEADRDAAEAVGRRYLGRTPAGHNRTQQHGKTWQ